VEGGISDNGGEEFAEFGEVAELSGHISNLTDGVRHVWGDFIEFIIQIQIICLSALVGVLGGADISVDIHPPSKPAAGGGIFWR
jgi:hypothetical protein